MQVKKDSVESIFAKISTLGFAGSGWQGDALDYIGEAIRGIGYHIGLREVKDFVLNVNNFKADIPSCFETISTVKFQGCPLVLVYDDEKLCNSSLDSPANYSDITEYNDIIDNINCLREKIIQDSSSECPDYKALDSMKNELNKAYSLVATFGTLGRDFSFYKGQWFSISNNQITTSFMEGEITIDGLMFEVDSNGYPLIVDTFKYKEALYWYVLYKMLLGEYDHPKIDWQTAYNMWETYRSQASNEGLMLDKNQMERFARRWLSITRDSRELYRS